MLFLAEEKKQFLIEPDITLELMMAAIFTFEMLVLIVVIAQEIC